MSAASVAAGAAKFVAEHPELAEHAVSLVEALLAGKSGEPELRRLKTSADAERARRRAIARALNERRK